MTGGVLAAGGFDPQVNLVAPLLSGLFQGAAYGLLGLGLVLIYKSNRIFNFAQGEFATVGALVAFVFATGYRGLPQLPYFVAVALALAASTGVALLGERVVIRPLFARSKVVLVVGTVGIALFLLAAEGMAFPQSGALRSVGDALGLPPRAFAVDGVPVLSRDLVNLVVLAGLAVAAYLFFRYTPTGTAILAVSQDATAARVVGISVERISMVTWGLAGLIGGVAGVLLAPATGVVPGVFTGTTLTTAFAAAVLGGMTSLPGAFVGGLLMGLLEAFANADAQFVPGLASLPSATGEVAVAVVLLLVLLVRPRGLLGREA